MRSKWKGFYLNSNYMFDVMNNKMSLKKEDKKIYSRSSTIIKQMEGLTLTIHNGYKFIPVTIIPEMIGHKLGEFSFTRQIPSFKEKLMKKPTLLKKLKSRSKR